MMLDDFVQPATTTPQHNLDEPVFLNDASYANQEEPRKLQETHRPRNHGPAPHNSHERVVLCSVLWVLMWVVFLRCCKKTVQSVRKLHKVTQKDNAADVVEDQPPQVTKAQNKVKRLEAKAQMFAARLEAAREELRRAEEANAQDTTFAVSVKVEDCCMPPVAAPQMYAVLPSQGQQQMLLPPQAKQPQPPLYTYDQVQTLLTLDRERNAAH